MKRVLFVRMDRIGDLVLSLPVDQSFRTDGCDVIWWITDGLGFVCEHSVPQRRYQQWRREFALDQFNRAVQMLEALKPDAVFVLHAPWWVSLAVWLAKVPLRVGSKSQWHSFLFFNRGLRQRRSQALMHELDYNFQLVESGLPTVTGLVGDDQAARKLTQHPSLQLDVDAQTLQNTRNLFPEALRDEFVVVHPGMSGSALNWPTDSYIDLIDQLVGHTNVIITGTASDQPYIDPIRAVFRNHPRVTFLDQKLKPSMLLAVLKMAKAVVAPSTGVVHLAASLGTRTLGIYSPVPVQKALRWGPRGANTFEFTPAVTCPAQLKCLGLECNKYPCMKLITPTQISEKIG